MIVVGSFAAARQATVGRLGLVPTMGYLHEGHLACAAALRSESVTTKENLKCAARCLLVLLECFCRLS